ncbi:MAG: DUF2130 domain-containing protein [Bacteroidales bacterium]
MENNAPNITCPNCGIAINVNEILYAKLQEEIKKEYMQQLIEQQKAFEQKETQLLAQKLEIEKQKNEISESIESGVKQKLISKKSLLEKKLRNQIADEKSEEIKSINEQLMQKIAEARELNKTKVELERLKREKDELKEKIEAESELKLTQTLIKEKENIRKEADEKTQKQVNEKEHVIQQLRDQLTEAQRKANQGSMQTQGEVQEVVIEEMLKDSFPFDIIEEVGKGVKGADVIHRVRNQYGILCGTILYESKNTKSFSNDWIKKLKSDALLVKADICIIISEVLPEGINQIGQKDGIWICSIQNFKSLVLVLRDSLIQVNAAINSQTNKGEKMQMLYDYLTSNEFRLQIESILDGFNSLKEGYNKERQSMERIWKEREKQLDKVLLNTNHFIGSIKGIAGSSLNELKQIGEIEN